MAKAKGKKTAGKKVPAKKAVAKKEAKEKKAQAPKETKEPKEKVSKAELDALRKPVQETKARLDKAEAEAKEVQENVRKLVAKEKDAYLKTLIPYRDACKKAGVECEFGGGRLANVSERVSFLVEKVDKGIKVAIKGRPETEEVIPLAKLKESVTKASYDYCNRMIGPKEEIGNKGGGLSNRLRALLK